MMRRRVEPVLGFLSVALIALGLVALGRWASLTTQLHELDHVIDFERVWTSERFDEWYSDDDERLEAAALVTLGVAGVGALLLLARRRTQGAVVIALGLGTGVVLAALYVRYSMVIGYYGIRCGPFVSVPTAHDFLDVRRFALISGVFAALGWVAFVRTFASFVAALLSVGLLATPLVFEHRTAFVCIASLTVVGLVLAWFTTTELARAPVYALVPLGISMAWLAVVISHDEHVAASLGETHRLNLAVSRSGGLLTTERCEPASMSPLVFTHDGLVLSGRDFVDEEQLFEHLSEIQSQRASIGNNEPLSLNVEASRNLSLGDFFAALRAFGRLENRTSSITIVFVKIEDAPLWSRRSLHEHTCGLRVELAADGRRESEFRDFEAVFTAAAPGGLRLAFTPSQ